MIYSFKKELKQLKVILVSESYSRKFILEKINLFSFTTMKSGFEEDISKISTKDYKDYCIKTTDGKVNSFLENIKKKNIDFDIAICCDTIIRDEQGNIFEKPGTIPNHIKMLEHFSNQNVYAVSAISIISNDENIKNILNNNIDNNIKIKGIIYIKLKIR